MLTRACFTIPLERLRARDLPRAGGKAVVLGRLIRAGLPVPPGFVLTTSGFARFVATAPEWAEWCARLDVATGGWHPSGTEVLCEEILHALEGRAMPAEVREAIDLALEEFRQVRFWAVRSSATAEDLPSASFAGQHDSFLNVPREKVPDRVRRCWLSLFAQRAVVYRERNHVPHHKVAMAVVLQEMVAADVAGVLFTADPTTGNPERILIEAAKGLGEQVVSGHVAPERTGLERSSLAVVERTSDELKTSPAAATSGFPLLDEITVRHLAVLGLRVEEQVSGPLDVEWAVSKGQVHLLQARPITSSGARKAWEDRQVWSNVNTGEVFPDVLTPLTWSLIQRFLDPLFRSAFRLHGADLSRSPLVGLVAGRPYFNVNSGLAGLKPFSFIIKGIPRLLEALGGGDAALSHEGLSKIPDEDLPDVGFRWFKYICHWPAIAWSIWMHSPRRGDLWCAALKRRHEQMADVEIESLSVAEQGRLFGRLVRKGFEDWDLLYLVVQAACLPIFQKACADWLGDKDLAVGYRLFSGLGGVPEAEAGLALWRLAALAHGDRETETIILGGGAWSEIRARLKPGEAGRRFLEMWNAFMNEHGHHCRGELELFNPRWSETPEYILRLVRGYLTGVDLIDPAEQHRRLTVERERLTAQCRARLTNPVKRWIFDRSLTRAQKLAVNREEWKNQAVRQIAFLRRIVLRLGSHLEKCGLLAHRDDVFFLQISELELVSTGGAHFAVADLVRRRREEYDHNLTLAPPPVVFGRFRPSGVAEPLPADAPEVMHGIPVCSGTAIGRARIILRADDHEQVCAGEILVAPFTDPAWTPYFVPAAGVVMDQGGILSHGSIVAREYGLPAVTNVGSATRALRTGDLIQVDGTAGRVTLLKRAERPGC